MKTYIVQLEEHDDVISTRDKISWSKAGRVLLVWPRKGRVLERRVDLLVLQRHARQLGQQMAVVTRSGEVKTHAAELGIPVFKNAAQAQRATWLRLRHRPKPPWKERALTDPHLLREQWRNQHAEVTAASVKENRWLRWAMFPVGVLSFLALVLFFAPEAVIDLSPARKPQELTMNVWASPSIRFANPSGGLPAQPLSVVVEGRDQAPSTGRSRIPDRPATGAVLLTNLTDGPVEIPEGSIVLTALSPAVRFAVTQDVQIPAGVGKTATTRVKAVLSGSAGNLPVGRIRAMEGPLGLRLTVDNPAPTSGGTDRSMALPTELDYANLQTRLLASLQARAQEEIQAKLKPGQRLLEGTLRLRAVVEESREPAKDQPGDQLQLSERVEFEAWAVNETDLQAVAQTGLDANREADFQSVPGSLQVEFVSQPKLDPSAVTQDALTPASSDGYSATPVPDPSTEDLPVADTAAGDTASAHWQIRAVRTLESSLPEASIIRSVQGRGRGEAQQILSGLTLANAPQIRIFPDWWQRLPYLPFRIQLVKQ
jgi:hypothetical protein